MNIPRKAPKKSFIVFLLILIIILVLIIGIQTISNNQKRVESEAVGINTGSSAENILEIIDCLDNEDSQKCMDDFILNYSQSREIKDILAESENARLINSSFEASCHPITHSIGRVTFQKFGNVGDAFEACDQSCHSGCYHGVMERLFYGDEDLNDSTKHLSYEDMKEKIPGICSSANFRNPSNSVIFQCLHGVGHAIMYSLDYDLEQSLLSCDLLGNEYERSSCYGGVLMENVTAFEKEKRDIKVSDPNYPCNKLDKKYQSDCYVMQTSLMFEYGMTIDQISNACLQATPFEAQCFTSLGRDLSNYVRSGSIEYVTTSCEDHSSGYSVNCVNGTIYALIDNYWDPRISHKFCDTLSNSDLKEQCFSNGNAYLRSSYSKSPSELEAYCSQYSDSNIDMCISTIN